MTSPTIGSPRAIALERENERMRAESEAEKRTALRTLHQDVLGGRRGFEYLADAMTAGHLFEAVGTQEEEGQRRTVIRTLYHLGVLTPENIREIARFMLRLPTGRGKRRKASPVAESERAIRVGQQTDPQEVS